MFKIKGVIMSTGEMDLTVIFKDEPRVKKELANELRVKMLMFAFNEYQRTVSNINTLSDNHIITINK